MKPGEDLVIKGISDLEEGRETVESLLVSIGVPRLRQLGLKLSENTFSSPEHALYLHLTAENLPRRLPLFLSFRDGRRDVVLSSG